MPVTLPVRVPEIFVMLPFTAFIVVAPTPVAVTLVAVRVFTLLMLLLHISRLPLRATEPTVRVPISATPTRANPVLTRRVEILSMSEVSALKLLVEIKMEEREFARISLHLIAPVLSFKEDRLSAYTVPVLTVKEDKP